MAVDRTIRVGVLGFDGVEALDMLGPLETFAMTRAVRPDLRPAYETVLIGLSTRSFKSESNVQFVPHATLERAGVFDTIIVPGGAGLREPHINRVVSNWLQNNRKRVRRIASVCTGAYGLASAGLLHGRRAATHWAFADDLQRQYPGIRVDSSSLFVKDGPFYSSAGITAGVDLTLALIEEDHGPAVALAVARYLVVYVKRNGGQEQFSEPLQHQQRNKNRFADLMAWMHADLRRDLSVETLAAKVHMSPRHFSRLFSAEVGMSPGQFIESARLNEARRRLLESRAQIERIAASTGYASADAFRRAFQRRFGLAPREYRARFGTASSSSLRNR